jgi:hypothetical protein
LLSSWLISPVGEPKQVQRCNPELYLLYVSPHESVAVLDLSLVLAISVSPEPLLEAVVRGSAEL